MKALNKILPVILGTLALTSIGCGLNNGNNSSANGDANGDTCFDCTGSQAGFLHLDSENVAALLSVDTSSLSSSSGALTLSGAATASEEDSPLQGIDADSGEIRDSLRCFTEETGASFDANSTEGLSTDCFDSIPRIITIAECDDYVYLAFERPFIVRTEAVIDGQTVSIQDYSDPWSASSPFTSQLLRSSQKITDYHAGDRVEQTNLTPVISGLELNTWDRRRNIQFDGDCNLYVTAHTPGTGKDTLIKIAPKADENDYTEVINSNICYQGYLVTDGGDVHYTGNTSVGGDCSGDSFYRMVSSDGILTEITRGWWDYEFEPEDDGSVIFYGPDPTQSGVASWDSACLFKFDNTSGQTGNDRYTKLVNCTSDWWQYVTYGPDDSNFLTTSNDTEVERCAEQFYTYRGSNVPDKILSIDRDGDGTKEICTVSDVEYKLAGTWKCDICADSGTGYCKNSSGVLTGDTTQNACTATSGNTWSTNGECFNGITTSACTITQPSGWNLNHTWCENPGTNWSQTYSGLSCIQSDKSVDLLSSTSETVTNAWETGDKLIYNSVESGEYCLKSVSFDNTTDDGDAADGTATVTELLCGIEMYEVVQDPENDNQLLINGLHFSDNSYVFGTIDIDSGETNFNTGLTGLVDTILVVQ